ncbi:MAG: O-antigen ligase family protein [Candidatus Brocadiia bacterium]
MSEATERTAHNFRALALVLLGLVVLYRPVVSGGPMGITGGALFGLILLTSAFLWLASDVLRGRFRLRCGPAAVVFCLFLLLCLVSSLRAEYSFPGYRWTWLMATLGLTAFLVIQLGDTPAARRFLFSCLAATGVALAAYALWHYAAYLPGLRRWLEQQPELFEAVARTTAAGMGELRARAASPRAYGTFVTANQLASFAAAVAFPLLGVLAGEVARRRNSHAKERFSWAAAAMLVMPAVALLLSGSRGGWAAALLGLAVFVAAARPQTVRRNSRKLLAGAALLGAALIVVLLLYGDRIREAEPSLAARTDYWRASVQMAQKRPFTGVGPGSWDEWYAQLKPPEFQESKLAHSAYLQMLAEVGAPALLCFLAVCGLVLWRAGRAKEILPDEPDNEREESPLHRRYLLPAGLAVAAGALLVDYLFIGTLHPPQPAGAPWIAAAPTVPYLLVYIVWALSFGALMRDEGLRMRDPHVVAGLGAGMAAFLLHSAGEFTLQVPGLATAAAVVGSLFVVAACPPRVRQRPTGPLSAGAALFLGGVLILVWLAFPATLGLRYGLSMDSAESLRALVLTGQPGEKRAARALEAASAYGRACAAVPWDDTAWHSLGSWLLESPAGDPQSNAERARAAAWRAAALNPLHSNHWALVGRASAVMGEQEGAAAAYYRAAQLYPSLPAGWYRFGLAARGAEGHPGDAAGAFERAAELLDRQYHRRTKVLGSPTELVRLWSLISGRRLYAEMLDMWQQAWDEGDHRRPWTRLKTTEKLEFAFRHVDMTPAEFVNDMAGGLRNLWEAAPADRRLELLVRAATELGERAGELPKSAEHVDAPRRLLGALPDGEGLVARWESWTDAERLERLWQTGAPRMWKWGLLAAAEDCRERLRRSSDKNGASGGD